MKPRYYYQNSTYDQGMQPFVTDLQKATLINHNFRTALWTGEYLQLTLMELPVNSDIGLEVHPNLDQMLYIESGFGYSVLGPDESQMSGRQMVSPGYAIFIPAGTWHNLLNTGRTPMKVFSIYAPPQHPFGTTHETKADAKH